MAEFRVIKAKVKVFPHPNAENLELLKIGAFQAVVQKDTYRDGDVVVFAPEKALLPDEIAEDYRKYLKGQEKNRVGTIRLRGELSMGVIVPIKKVDPEDKLPYDEDISASLGIVKYEPPIPANLRGQVVKMIDFDYLSKHDVEQFQIYVEEFAPGEPIRIFEKIHGSQGIYLRNKQGEIAVSSKGILKSLLTIQESPDNIYWIAARNMGIFEMLGSLYPDRDVQLFGEVIPVQKGYGYGYNKPHVLFFKVIVDGKIVNYQRVPEAIKNSWVPLLYQGEFDRSQIISLCQNLKTESVSGCQLHIAEGGVVMPIEPRLSSENFDLQLKVISKAYAKVEDEEAIS